jgi:hypothetical protein
VYDIRAAQAGKAGQPIQRHLPALDPGVRRNGNGGVEGVAAGVVRRSHWALRFQQMVPREFVLYLSAQILARRNVVVPELHPFIPDLLQVLLVCRRPVCGFEIDRAAHLPQYLLEPCKRTRHSAAEMGSVHGVSGVERFGTRIGYRRQGSDAAGAGKESGARRGFSGSPRCGCSGIRCEMAENRQFPNICMRTQKHSANSQTRCKTQGKAGSPANVKQLKVS